MLAETNDGILAEVSALNLFKKVDVWAGDIDDLLKQTVNLPAAYLIFTNATNPGAPADLGGDITEEVQIWTLVIISNNLRSRSEGVLGCYTYIEAVRNRLKNFAVGGGWLWPTSVSLLLSEKKKLAYGLDFILETEV